MTIETALATPVKIVCSRDELARVLGVVGRAVSTRGSVQILAGIVLNAADGRVTAAATDMEMSLRVEFGGDVDGEGAVVVPGRLLVDIVRLLPPGDVTLAHDRDESTLELTCGAASY